MALNQVVIPGFAAFHLGIADGDLSQALLAEEEDDDWRPEAVDPDGRDLNGRDLDERPEE